MAAELDAEQGNGVIDLHKWNKGGFGRGESKGSTTTGEKRCNVLSEGHAYKSALNASHQFRTVLFVDDHNSYLRSLIQLHE